MTIYYDTFDSSFGRFSVACDPGGALLATAFGELPSLLQRLAAARFGQDSGSATSEFDVDERFHAARDRRLTREVRGPGGDVTVPADYGELGWLLITVAAISLLAPLVTILAVQSTMFRSTD